MGSYLPAGIRPYGLDIFLCIVIVGKNKSKNSALCPTSRSDRYFRAAAGSFEPTLRRKIDDTGRRLEIFGAAIKLSWKKIKQELPRLKTSQTRTWTGYPIQQKCGKIFFFLSTIVSLYKFAKIRSHILTKLEFFLTAQHKFACPRRANAANEKI